MPRQKNGSTIWLVIAGILILAIIGIAFIYISRIMSGGMEVANAVDAGTLNVAKQALVRPSVDVGSGDLTQFAGLGEDGSNNEINLATYNRAVALAIMVAANAEDENTAEARNHARLVFIRLKQLQAALSARFDENLSLGGAFINCAEPNAPRMLGPSSTVRDQGTIQSGYFHVGGASNIYFVDNQLPPGRDLSQFLVSDAAAGTAPGGHRWLAGYKPISIGQETYYATPVFPGKTPHLISQRDFGGIDAIAGVPTPGQAVLPNCFRKCGMAVSQQSNSDLQSQASAVVGALNRQYPARFPKGYIRIVNPNGLNPGYGGSLVSDGSNDLFNKELFAPSKVSQSNNGVFSTDVAQLAAWVAYNNSSGSDQYGRDGSLDPRNLGMDVNQMRFGAGRGQRATLQQLLEIQSIECTCTNTNFDRTTSNNCEDNTKVTVWASNFGRSSRNTQFSGPRGYTSIEWLKMRCLEERSRIGRTFGVLLPAPDPTGLMLFEHGRPYPVPQVPVQFSQVGTPWKLMEQVGPCATTASGSAFSRIFRRCRQIDPDCTIEAVRAVLDSQPLPLGATLYVYMNSAGRLVMDTTGPSHKTNIAPDGPTDAADCLVRYDFEGTTVNTARASGSADADFEDKPWSQASCPRAVDKAIWTDASGYENLLGVLEFENSITGTSEFGAPN